MSFTARSVMQKCLAFSTCWAVFRAPSTEGRGYRFGEVPSERYVTWCACSLKRKRSPMDVELTAFLSRHKAQVVEDVVWSERMRLRVTAYLSKELPPMRYTTSARATVIRDGSVLVVQDGDDSHHILPGGRLEKDEHPETAVRREVGEESGWELGMVQLLGFIHFLHLDPQPPGYGYPYPDFLQVVYAAEAIVHSPELMIKDDYVIGSELAPLPVVRQMSLTPKERLYLRAAARAMQDR